MVMQVIINLIGFLDLQHFATKTALLPTFTNMLENFINATEQIIVVDHKNILIIY